MRSERVKIKLRYFVEGASFCTGYVEKIKLKLPDGRIITSIEPRPYVQSVKSGWQASFEREKDGVRLTTTVPFVGVHALTIAVGLALKIRQERWG